MYLTAEKSSVVATAMKNRQKNLPKRKGSDGESLGVVEGAERGGGSGVPESLVVFFLLMNPTRKA